MKKRYFVFMSLLMVMMCSCNQQTPSDSSSSDSSEVEPILKPYDMKEDYIIQADPWLENEYLEAIVEEYGPYDFCLEYFSNIPTIVDEMTYDDTHQLYIPNLYTQHIYATLHGRYLLKTPGTISFTDNGYFAFAGSAQEDTNYYFHDGIIYNYVYCNQEVEILPYHTIIPSIEKELYFELHYEIKEKDDGYLFHIQYAFEKEGNQYVVGSKMFSRNINTNSKAVQYVNEHSALDIPLGCPKENLSNIDQFENELADLNKEVVKFNYRNFTYHFSDFIVDSFVNYSKYDWMYWIGHINIYRLADVILESSEARDNICGVNCTMSIEEAKNLLIQQGFNYQELEIPYGEELTQSEMNYFFSMDNVMIVIGKSQKNSQMLKIRVYIDLFGGLDPNYFVE